jgi:hypothetical protein
MRFLPLALLAACVSTTSPTGKSTTAPDTGTCDAAEAPIGWDDDTAFGTPRALAERNAFEEDPDFTYADATVTPLHLVLAPDLSREPSGATLIGGDADCTVPREVTVPMRLAFETGDGAFTEDVAVDLVVTDTDESVRGQPYIPVAEHLGAFDATGWDEVNLAFGTWTPPTGGEVVLISDARGECGVGSWNSTLSTGCAAR